MKLAIAITTLLAIGAYGRSIELTVMPHACDPVEEPVVSILPVPTDKLPVQEVGVIEEVMAPLFGAGDISLVSQPTNKLPTKDQEMEPTFQIMPIVEESVVSILPVDGATNKLPVRPIREPTFQIMPIVEEPVVEEVMAPVISIMPVPTNKLPVEEVGVVEEVMAPEVSILPVGGATNKLPVREPTFQIMPIVEEPVVEEVMAPEVSILPVDGSTNKLPVRPIREPTFQIMPIVEEPVVEEVMAPVVSILPVPTNKLPVEEVGVVEEVMAPVVSILPVAPEEGCDKPSDISIQPVEEQHDSNKWIIF